jgi:hypothetical protein
MKYVALWLLATVLFFACTGCTAHAAHSAKVVLVFVDESASVRDFTVYREAWSKVLTSLHGGDRIILAPISSRTYTAFRPLLDCEMPDYSYLRDNKLTYDQKLATLERGLNRALERAASQPKSNKTDILNALVLAEKVFAGDHRHHVLLLLTDGIEDSEEYSFERSRLSDSFTKRVIERAREEGRLPNLGGAAVYVAGASARSARKAREIERFWLLYVEATHGHLLPRNYGPALLGFEE